MEWLTDFLDWCVRSRDLSRQQAEWLESGQAKFFHNNVDVTADWAERHRRNADEMDALIAKVEGDLRKRQKPQGC